MGILCSRVSTVLLLAFLLTSCARDSAPPENSKEELKKFSIHGQIVQLDAKDKLATIKHHKIEGWMEAMTMDFPVKDEKEFSTLHVGDTIDASVFVQGLNYWVGEIHPASADTK